MKTGRDIARDSTDGVLTARSQVRARRVPAAFAAFAFAFAVAVVLVFAFAVFGVPGGAYAEDDIEPSDKTTLSSFMQKHKSGEPGHVFLVVAPTLSWEDITQEETPTLYYLTGRYAVCNVVNDDWADWTPFKDSEFFHLHVISEGTHHDVEKEVAAVWESMDEGDSLIVTSSPCLAGLSPSEEQYSLFILRDTDDNGMLTSTTTRRSGLITATDAYDAVQELLGNPQRKPANLDIYLMSWSDNAQNRIQKLSRDNSVVTALNESIPSFALAVAVYVIAVMLFSVAMLLLETLRRPRFLRYALPLTRLLWLTLLALPLASFLVFIIFPQHVDAEIAFDYFIFCALFVAFACIVVALMSRWRNALLLILVVTVVTLCADQLAGGVLSAGGYLSYSPLGCVRYYGIGNQGAAILFGSWLTFSALMLNWYGGHRRGRVLRSWGFPLGSAFVLAVIAAPWWGANFGIIIWGTPAFVLAWLGFRGRRMRKRWIAATLAGTVVLALVVLYLDTTYNLESHMGAGIDFQNGMVLEQLGSLVGDVVELSWNTLTYSPPLTAFFAVALAFMIGVYALRPGGYRRFWTDHGAFAAGYKALLLAAVLMLFVEDSGILMPSLALVYPFAALIWLECDKNSWHIRDALGDRVRRSPAPASANAEVDTTNEPED